MSSQRELALYLNNLQGHTTQQKIEAILEMEADCNLDEVCLMKVIENRKSREWHNQMKQCILDTKRMRKYLPTKHTK